MGDTITSFLNLFSSYKPFGYLGWRQEKDVLTTQNKVETGLGFYSELEAGSYDKATKEVVELRKETDGILFAWPHMVERWDETETEVAKKAAQAAREQIDELKKKFELRKKQYDKSSEDDRKILDTVEKDLGSLATALTQADGELESREGNQQKGIKGLEPGQLTGRKKGDLLQGWNPETKKFEYQPLEEWTNIKQRFGKVKPSVSTSGTTEKMTDLGGFAFVKNQASYVKSMTRLLEERTTTAKLRTQMTATVNKRVLEGPPEVKKGVENHCEMAEKLTKLFEKTDDFDPKALFEDGGLLARLKGTWAEQGAYEKPTPDLVKETILGAAGRLKKGEGQSGDSRKGTSGDANYITSFIANFVDGLTEANELREAKQEKKDSLGNTIMKDGKPELETVMENGKKKMIPTVAADQLDKLWPKLMVIFGLKKEDKFKLLERVDAYKKAAGGIADTSSGKATRKGVTRAGAMPTDDAWKIHDDEALIKGDVSGSMQSQLLAHELSESLIGGGGIKGEDAPVLIKNKAILNARALDALLMTAGGKERVTDAVFHTAYEMINGMQAISGCPEVTQDEATEIMLMLRDGTSFTDAMEKIFAGDQLPWMEPN